MPRSSSTSRSEVRRRDRHKVYAVADLQDDVRGVSSPSPAIMKEFLEGKSRTATLSRGGSERRDSKAAFTDGRVGVRVRDHKSSHEAPASPAAPAAPASNPGSVGPGAEPPVAVASHAFAHEEPQTETPLPNRSKSGEQEAKDGAGPSSPGDERVRVVSTSEEDVSIRGGLDQFGTTEPSRRYHRGKENAAGSRPGSTNTNNEEEAETLPDSFNLSDEYGLEGASTGRNHHDDDDDCDGKAEEPVFFGLEVESTSSGNREKRGRGQERPPAGRYSRDLFEDEDSSSEYEPRPEKGGGGVYAGASGSDDWPLSSRERHTDHGQTSPQPQRWLGRRTRQNSRRPLLTSTKRNSRIVPVEAAGERGAGESEGTRRHRRGRSRNSAQYRSPPPRRHPRDAEDDKYRRRGRRGVSGPRSRDGRRPAHTETESTAGEVTYRFEAEMARLRRENEALKQQQERPTRLSDGGFETEHWTTRQESDERHKRSPQHSSRWHDPTDRKATRRKRLTRKNDALRAQEQPRDLPPARVSDPVDIEISSARSSSRRRQHGSSPRAVPATSWSDFVSRSKPSSHRPGPATWGAEPLEGPAEEVDVDLPRILVEGGFLWKLPYHNAGMPKRRWFQVKPADGLLTTASGHLVVRPTVAGGGGATAWDGGSAHSERGDEGGSGKDPATSMPMMRLRAAWPLVFIWVDPDKDLKRSPPREMCIEEIVDLARGHKTPAFWQQAAHRGIHTLPDPKLCFSLVGHDRTLDLAAETLSEAKEWVRALARVTLMIKRRGAAAATGDPPVSFSRSQLEPVACSNPGEVHGTETAADDADTLCSEGSYPRRPGGAAASLHKDTRQHDLSARSEAGGIPTKAPLLGEGGAWSADTIRAWRRSLFPAVTRGDVPAVLALFDQGCPVDLVQTGTGDTPMLLACRLGDIEMTRECLRRGSRNDPHPEFGQTALHAAVASGQEACARLLLETAAPSRSDAVISNHKDPNKETPLHVACRGGYSGIVDALLHHGGDMRAVDKRGNTPLHGAAGGGHADALASLLDAGGDGVLEERNARGDRALHAAAAAGHIACVELLLGIAAEPDVPNEDGQTPFALASRGGHLAVTGLIRQYAPAAGTPSGGDAQFQALQLRSFKGGSATADTLPRPHASGSTSSGPGTPDHRSRDLEHRCYSAAGLDQRQLEASAGGTDLLPGRRLTYETGADVVERGHHKSGVYGHDEESHSPAVPRPAGGDEQVLRPPPLCSSAPVHGSLFDGLQVYVVGGRQPLGSQHASGVAAAGRLSARSAHTTTTARTMVLDSQRLSMSSNQHHSQHQLHQREQPQEQPQNCFSSSQHASLLSASTASFSSGVLDPNWRDNVLSAPSTVAPSPPAPLYSNAGISEGGSAAKMSAIGPTGAPTAGGVPGSARALARMMHFSGGNNHTAASCADSLDSPGRATTTRGVVGSSVSAPTSSNGNVAVEMAEAAVGSASLTGSGGRGSGGGDNDDGTPTEAIGSWMCDHEKSVPGSATSIPKLRQYGDGNRSELTCTSHSSTIAGATFSDGVESAAISEGWVLDRRTAGRDDVAEERTAVGGYSFVVKPSEERGERKEGGAASAPLPGLWRVFESQGYPYYLHEASGHSQWEDPREHENARFLEPLSTMTATDAAADVRDQVSDIFFEGNKGAIQKEVDVGMAVQEAIETPKEKDKDHSPPVSPIKPTGVPVAVDVSRYVDTGAAARSAEKSADWCGEAGSKSSRITKQERGNGEILDTAPDTTLEDKPGRTSSSIDGCDSHDFDSIDTASLQGGNGSGSGDGPFLPSMNDEERSVMKGDEGSNDEGSSYDSDDDCRQDAGGNTTGVTSHRPTYTSTGGDANSEGGTEDTDEGAKGPLRHDVVAHDDASLPADRPDLSVATRTCGTKNGHSNERQEQEEDVEEEWWQELDDKIGGDTKL